MSAELTELDSIGRELERLFDLLERMAMERKNGEEVAETWVRTRFWASIAFDKHAALLREARRSTFANVEAGEPVRALQAINEARRRRNEPATLRTEAPKETAEERKGS